MSSANPVAVEVGDPAHHKERMAFLNREAAEVYLLLDFLSGRADRSLRPTQEEQARFMLDRQSRSNTPASEVERQREEIEDDLSDPTRLVLRTMRISYPIAITDKTFEPDATFLVRARDVLNTRASPANGLTIAFTLMVFGRSRSGQPSIETLTQFAERAYPQFQRSAHWLARWITSVLYALAVVLVVALGVSGYTAWGKVMLDTLDAVRRDDGATQQELNAALRAGAAGSQPATPCIAGIDERPACRHAEDIKVRYGVTSLQLAQWEQLIRRDTTTLEDQSKLDEQKQTEQWATAFMAVLGNYLMPILYALLGSMAFVLRRHYDRLAAQLLSPRDLRANSIRLALGALIGGCIGLVYSGSSAAQTTGILGAATSLSTAAIAFLAGYGVEGAFKTLDALITQVFRVNDTEKPPQQAR